MDYLPEIAGAAVVALIGAGFGVRKWLAARGKARYAKVVAYWPAIGEGSSDEARNAVEEMERDPAIAAGRDTVVMAREMRLWFALRHEPLSKAEEAAAAMLHFADQNASLPKFVYASALYTHGCLLVEEESWKYALERFSNARFAIAETYGDAAPHVVPPMVALAWLHFRSDQYVNAGKLLAQALKVYERAFGKDHFRTARVRAMLALVACAAGLRDEVRRDLEEAAAALESIATYAATRDSKTIRTAITQLL